MATGPSGRHGIHAVWHVEGETGHVFAHALIQRQNGTERIAVEQISPQRHAICTNVKVDAFSTIFRAFHFGAQLVFFNFLGGSQF